MRTYEWSNLPMYWAAGKRNPCLQPMNKYIQYPKIEGTTSRQAHTKLPPGTYEREVSKEGFFGPAAHIYHRHPPTGWTHIEGPLRPRAFDLAKLTQSTPSPWDAIEIVKNDIVRIRFWRFEGCMSALVRNADGDELVFVHSGRGDLYCDYGHLTFERGDYILLPRGTMWRVECQESLSALLIEAANASYKLPERGLLGHHAIFDPAIIDVPRVDDAFLSQANANSTWRVEVNRHRTKSIISYPFNPLDAVGWHGDLAVSRLNVRDIRPVTSHRYHLPPSAHTTFVAPRFVVCTFVPRPFETDSEAIKVPFFHSNDDFDELVFYHEGKFFSRDDMHPGMVTLHPSGITHGPHPKALKNLFVQPNIMADEVAVMIDSRDALDVADGVCEIEVSEYAESWKESV